MLRRSQSWQADLLRQLSSPRCRIQAETTILNDRIRMALSVPSTQVLDHLGGFWGHALPWNCCPFPRKPRWAMPSACCCGICP